jgi:PST family polysaccharide transporter
LGDPPIPVSPRDEGGSYFEILRSSALIGGSSLISIAIGVFRTKAMAILLGPAGIGLMGSYILIVDLLRSIAQMGVNASGVRQIAESAGSGDLERTSRTALVLRGTALVSAGLGAGCLALFAPIISEVTLATADQADDVAMLAAAVFFGVIAGGQLAVVQGMRRITDLSKINILGAAFGTFASISLIYLLGKDGIVLSLISVAILSVGTGWWYRRKIALPKVSLTFAQTLSESSALLKLGLAFMASGFLMLSATYIVRVIIMQNSGPEAAGLYQAAWTLGGFYIGFLLQAMGADFYPRLVSAVDEDDKCNRLVNEQATVSLLLAAPGVVVTLTFAPVVVVALYSPDFAGAADILRWICLGMALRIITWPIGYIIVAKNLQRLFFFVELAWALANVGLTWILVAMYGVLGAGIAFFASYLFHALLLYPIVRKLTNFRWSQQNLRLGVTFTCWIAIVFSSFQLFSFALATAIGTIASVFSTFISIRLISVLVAPEKIPHGVQRFISLFRG